MCTCAQGIKAGGGWLDPRAPVSKVSRQVEGGWVHVLLCPRYQAGGGWLDPSAPVSKASRQVDGGWTNVPCQQPAI